MRPRRRRIEEASEKCRRCIGEVSEEHRLKAHTFIFALNSSTFSVLVCSQRITKVTRVSYRDMLFFDDDDINIQAVSQLGVCCTRVDKDTGLNFRALQCGLRHYEQTCSSRATMMAWLGSSREPSQAKEDTGNRKPSAESGVRTKPT